MTEVVAEATPQSTANHGMPPGRVRHMFKTLDTDGNGTLSLEELKKGFAKDFKVDALAPHVRAAVGSNQPTRGSAPQAPSACRPLAQIYEAPLCTHSLYTPLPAAQVVARMEEMFDQHADEKDGEKAP